MTAKLSKPRIMGTERSRLLAWLLALSALWFLLSEGDPASWAIGIPFIVLGLIIQKALIKGKAVHNRFSIRGLIRFTYFFLVESILGAVDVGRRVLALESDFSPHFFDYSIRLQHPFGRQLFINSIGLLPGTLCVDWNDGNAQIHALDNSQRLLQGIEMLEQKIATVFGESL